MHEKVINIKLFLANFFAKLIQTLKWNKSNVKGSKMSKGERKL